MSSPLTCTFGVLEAMSSPATTQLDSTPRPRPSRRGGGRGRGQRRGHRAPVFRSTDAQTSSSPDAQSAQTQRQPPTQHGETATSNTPRDTPRSRRGHRGGRGGSNRAGARGYARGAVARQSGAGGRAFEGRLTRPERAPDDDVHDEDDDMGDQGLRADAPEFLPGSQPGGDPNVKVKTRPRAEQPRSPKVATKSTAPDIATRIHEDIANHLYECPICTSELGRRSRIWSCKLCWTVFHLSCIKKWSKNEGSAAQGPRREGEEGTNSPRAWRCPGCNLAQEIFPSIYTCWCEKEADPRPLPGLPPHSCGQTCSRPRKDCPHPCDSTCHAGPCTPCTAMGPTQDCFCGRNSSAKRCQDTDYEHGWSCGETCGDLLPCGKHTCPRPCHEGLCGACEVIVESKCYCGKVETSMLCSARDEEMESQKLLDGELQEWTGSFSCDEICNRPFDCGRHFCQKNCHPQDAQPAHCPRSPDVVLHCPCGKTPLTNIPGFSPRTSCEDPIRNCSEPCGKTLRCGHPCQRICHTGPCGYCMRKVEINCRCGRNTFTTICHQGVHEPPMCFRICKSALHCGRHACAERCCPGEQKAIERQAMRRKLKSHLRPSDEDIEAEHICTRVCGRMLKCGRHTCPELCHKGSCNTCREAIFEEIPCNCGRTILYPPLPCGTQPPPCSFPCERPKACGHPQTAHNCHTDEENCPKCPFLTEKMCLCGKRLLKNQPCWLADARCGQVCGKPLKCGSHTCQKNCHRPGDCEDASALCKQPCGKTKTLCGHPCTEPCHAPYPCPEKSPCSSTILVTCSCGRLRQEKLCNAAKAVVSKGQLHHPQRLPSLTPLACDDECARLERNRSLASALQVDIDPSSTTSIPQNGTSAATAIPYSSDTLDMYIQLASSSPLSTLQTYESTLHSLATSTAQRSVRFQPAKRALRAFAHSLSADWGFASESFDPEPHRHVFVLKPTSWNPPRPVTGTAIGIGGMSVSDCVKLRERQRIKEREAQRIAAADAKAARDAAKANKNGTATDGGWAQVASRRKSPIPTSVSNAVPNPFTGSIYGALAPVDQGQSAKKERLILRSGVGAAKQLKNQNTAEVADNWEEEEEKEEQEEKRQRQTDRRELESAEPELEEEDNNIL